MHLRIFEAGKPEGKRSVDRSFTLDRGAVTLGGDGADVALPGVPDGPAAEIALEQGEARIKRLGGTRVQAGGRDVEPGGVVTLGLETLVAIEEHELVCQAREAGGPSGRGPESERPSVLAKDVLKQVYAALGVPEGDQPALIVYDDKDNMVRRVDLAAGDTEVTIGRDAGNRIVLHHASVSKSHARVVRDGLGWIVFDLESRNGLQVNGEVVKGKHRLKSGDRMKIGDFHVKLVDPRAAVQDMASVPDLKKPKPLPKPVEVGDKEAAAGIEDTHDSAVRRKQAPSSAPISDSSVSRKAAEAATGAGRGSSNLVLWLVIGIGVVVLLGAAGLFVLAALQK